MMIGIFIRVDGFDCVEDYVVCNIECIVNILVFGDGGFILWNKVLLFYWNS